jgi:pimeloyl-ACP methyl ester carboxylesterase
MATADPAQLDARVRADEAALARRISRTTIEHAVTTGTAAAVRVVEFVGDGGVSDDRPPIVLLHGIASVSTLALPVIAALEGRRILAVDWPGHGLSGADVLAKGAELRVHAASVLDAVWITLALDRVDLIGHSLGGHFGLLYALERPERIRRLALLGAPGAAFEGATSPLGMRLAAVPGLGTALLGLSTSQPATRRGFVSILGSHAVDALPHDTIEIAHLTSQRPSFAPTVASLFRALLTPFAVRPGVPLTRAALATLAAPTLLVLGDSDVILTQAAGAANMSAVPDGRMLEVTGGHAPWLDDPAVNPAVAAFLGDPA